MELVILVGPPGSGKSTVALNEYVPNGYVYVNQDTQGKAGHRVKFARAIDAKQNIVIDRMDFSRGQRKIYIDGAKSRGYAVTIRTLFVPYRVCLDRVLARTGHATINDTQAATDALDLFFRSYEPATVEEGSLIEDRFQYSERPEAVLVDIDGTTANLDHRLHYIKREKPDWNRFLGEVGNDTPNSWCVKLIYALELNYYIVLCSGRDETYRPVTENWLKRYAVHYNDLFMRPRGDYRKDYLVKEILLNFEILPRYVPLFAVDDRSQVVNGTWRKNGIVCLQCAPGDF